MKKSTKVISLSILTVVIIFGLFSFNDYLLKKINTDPEFQKILQKVEKNDPGSVSKADIDISLIPEYGGFQKTPEQIKADERFVNTVMNEFKDKRSASNEMIASGNQYYQKEDLDTAMRRYNQAWLLDETNPEVYIGFGNILKKRGDENGANEMFQKASNLR